MLINIQFLRFVAAMLVVVYHCAPHIAATGAEPGVLFDVGNAVGYAGVDIFFVISGFIMMHTTRGLSGPASSGQFLRRRFARIYSGYWPFLLLALAVFGWAQPERLQEADLFASATLWPGRVLLLAVSWTLTFEMYFYLCFGALVLAPERWRVALVAAALVFIVAWCGYAQVVRAAYSTDNLPYISLAEAYMASPYMAEFLAGALVAHFLSQRPQGPGLAWLLAGCALFLAGGWVNNAFYATHLEQGYYVVARVTLFGTASVLLLLGVVRMENAGRVAPLRFSLLCGGASYAIYLSHTLVLTVTQHLGLNAWLRGTSPSLVRVTFIALSLFILALSALHYRQIERRLHGVFRRWLGVQPLRPPQR